MVEFSPNYDAMLAVAQEFIDPNTCAADIVYLPQQYDGHNEYVRCLDDAS